MYNRLNQYRCIIIRGKSQKEIDDLLPAYAKVIEDITPCEEEKFCQKFNELLAPYLSADKRIKKTLDNHRTEGIRIRYSISSSRRGRKVRFCKVY